MNLHLENEPDPVGWKILTILQEDARKSFRQIGQEIGMSTPAVAERVRRMEEQGIISGYHAAINPKRLGISVQALMRIGGVGDRGEEFTALVVTVPEVLECHRVTGSDSYLLKVITRSIDHLETLINRFVPYGDVTTSLVLSSPVIRRTIEVLR
jgi:Lrp/AsnC family transcriptional regulator, leucine-responsive regulatory protein